MIARLELLLRRIRRGFGRSEWMRACLACLPPMAARTVSDW